MGEAAAALTRGTVAFHPPGGRCAMTGAGREETRSTEDTLSIHGGEDRGTRLATDREGGHILVVDRVVVDRVVPAQLSQ